MVTKSFEGLLSQFNSLLRKT